MFFKKNVPNTKISEEGEFFDSSLMRLTSVKKVIEFCDSVYGDSKIKTNDSGKYAGIMSVVLRGRFYHGYSYYGAGENSLAYLLSPIIKNDLKAIVIPDDILKHPNAACSQQSIVGMEVFKKKGYKVRKVIFNGEKYGGHFCFEAAYEGSWHFFDPDVEPELMILTEYNRPSFEMLNKNDSLLFKLYDKQGNDYVLNVFKKYHYGEVNEFPAPHARIFQYATKYLSYTLWFWVLLIFYFLRRKNRK